MIFNDDASLNNKGFTLIEVMIVVVIIGILAAISIPAYINYIHKARTSSLIIPGVHSIETNISLFASSTGRLPDGVTAGQTADLFDKDADLTYFNWQLCSAIDSSTGACTAAVAGTTAKGYEVIINSPAPKSLLKQLDTKSMSAEMVMASDGKITIWNRRGELADLLGLAN